MVHFTLFRKEDPKQRFKTLLAYIIIGEILCAKLSRHFDIISTIDVDKVRR